MELPRKISKLVNQSDLTLFTNGGCHVFAKVLLELTYEENYEVRRLHAKTEHISIPAYHVYLFSNGFAVDALGIRRECDLIAHSIARRGWGFTPVQSSISELFEPGEYKEETGLLSKCELYLHPGYVDYLAAKARLVILDCFDRYLVSTTIRGQMLIRNSSEECRIA